jgi:pyridoxine/pyridoxamine 5'-phosphate oxidase
MRERKRSGCGISAAATSRHSNTKGAFLNMATILSDKARAFLQEKHFSVLCTINKDGSAQLTTVLYALDDDETIVLNTQVHSQKKQEPAA